MYGWSFGDNYGHTKALSYSEEYLSASLAGKEKIICQPADPVQHCAASFITRETSTRKIELFEELTNYIVNITILYIPITITIEISQQQNYRRQ